MIKIKYFLFVTLLSSLAACGNSKEAKDELNDSLNNSNNSEIIEHPSRNLVDFYAVSDDWKLSIQFGKQLTLTSVSNNISFQGEIERTSVAQGADVVSLYSTKGKEIVRVNIDIVDCDEFGKRINIMHRFEDDKNGTDLSGCGFYRGNPELHNIWAVKQINKEELNPEKFPKDIPHFEINLETRKISGFAGCNQVNGKIRFEYKKMFIDPLYSSKMYCAGLSDIEDKILNILRQEPVFYKIKGNNLTLETTEGYIILKKVD